MYVSEDYAINEGLDAYKAALRKAPRLFRAEILAASVLGNPINGIRTALAYQIYTSIKPEENSYMPEKSIDITALKNTGTNYEFVLYDEAEKSKFFTVWKNNHNFWQIEASNLNGSPEKNLPKKIFRKNGKKTKAKYGSVFYFYRRDSGKNENICILHRFKKGYGVGIRFLLRLSL